MRTFIHLLTLGFILTLVLACENTAPHEVANAHEEEEHHHEEEGIIVLTDAQATQAGLVMDTIANRAIGAGVMATGMLEAPPQSLITISVPIGGFLKSTELLPGTKVRKGERIATMAHTDYIALQQSYWEIYSDWEYAKADYQRQLQLAKDEVNSQKEVDRAKSDLMRLTAKKNGLKAQLQMLHINPEQMEVGEIASSIPIYSPIDGYVGQVATNIGAYVRPMDVIFTLVDPHHLHAELKVYEKDIASIKVGQTIRFKLADSHKEQLATVYLIGKKVEEDRSISVHGHLNSHEDDDHLIPGMFLDATIETSKNIYPSVPTSAVMRYEGASYLFATTAETNHFEMIPIAEKQSENGYIAIQLPRDFDRQRPIVIQGAFVLLSKAKNSEEGGHHH